MKKTKKKFSRLLPALTALGLSVMVGGVMLMGSVSQAAGTTVVLDGNAASCESIGGVYNYISNRHNCNLIDDVHDTKIVIGADNYSLNCDGVTLENNGGAATMVEVMEKDYVGVTGCHFVQNGVFVATLGVDMYNSVNPQVNNNTFTRVNTAVQIRGITSGARIGSNTIESASNGGILLSGASGGTNTIFNNVINNTGFQAIKVGDDVNGATKGVNIKSNKITNSATYGLVIQKDLPDLDMDMDISNNEFSGNGQNVRINGTPTGIRWNLTAPLDYGAPTNIIGGNWGAGNYWDDNPNTIDANGDGLGDVPYTLNGVNDLYPLVYPTIACGNSIIEAGEQCDDGNTTNGDGCNATCQLEGICGNNVLEVDEQCDDGNNNSGDGCTASCVLEFCGDGAINNGGIEQCDDGNTTNGDGCSSTCVFETSLLDDLEDISDRMIELSEAAAASGQTQTKVELDKVTKHLVTALTSQNITWESDTQLACKYGNVALHEIRMAVEKLEKITNPVHAKKFDQSIIAELNEHKVFLTEYCQTVAEAMITEAEQDIKNMDEYLLAVDSFEDGNTDLFQGKYGKACLNFTQAWQHAKEALYADTCDYCDLDIQDNADSFSCVAEGVLPTP